MAPALLGRVLVHDDGRARVAGRIIEVEAYGGARDPASHAYGGERVRNRVMFSGPGHAYVYFTYGMHHCLNVVTGRPGSASGVLIRAMEPLEGIALMRRRRAVDDLLRLMRGPGCVAQALGVDLRHNGLDVTAGALRILDHPADREGFPLARGPRIGIRRAVEWPWRYWLAGHPGVSGRRGPASGPGNVKITLTPQTVAP